MSNYPVIIFAIVALFTWGIGDFSIQKIVRKIGVWGTIFWIGALGGLFLLPFCWHDLPKIFYCFNLLSLITLSFLFLLAGYLIFEALERGKLAVVEIVLTLELPITVVLGIFFFKEDISWWQGMMMSVIFLSIILIAKKPTDWWQKIRQWLGFRRSIWEKGVILTLFAAVISALVNFNTAVSSRHVGALTVICFSWLANAVVAFIIIYSQGEWQRFIDKSREIKSLIGLTALFDTLAWVAFSLATRQGELSLVIAISESYPAVSIFLAVKFNKEKISKYQYVGAVSALVVSFILALAS